VDFRTTVAHTFAFLFAAARSHVRVQFVARCSGRRLICLVCARSRYTQLAPEEIVQRFGKIVTFGVYRRPLQIEQNCVEHKIFLQNLRMVVVWLFGLDVRDVQKGTTKHFNFDLQI
jgi:hypothetical protein